MNSKLTFTNTLVKLIINFKGLIDTFYSFNSKGKIINEINFIKENFYCPLKKEDPSVVLNKISGISINTTTSKMNIIYNNNSTPLTVQRDFNDFYNVEPFLGFYLNKSDKIEFDGIWKVKEDFNFLEKYDEFGVGDLDFLKTDNFNFKKGEIIALEVKDHSNFLNCRHQIIRNIIGLRTLENLGNTKVKFLLIMKDPICVFYQKEIIELQEYIKQTFKNYELIVISLLTTMFFGKDTITLYSGSQKHKIFSEENNKILQDNINSIRDEMNTKFKAVGEEMIELKKGMDKMEKGMSELKNEMGDIRNDIGKMQNVITKIATFFKIN